MCNIAGYVGHKQATPLLIEMMRKEQGFCGGYYTGIATVNEGKINYEKRLGDLDYLLAHTPAANLKGTIGLLHSRSNSEGNDEWSHPFLDNTGKEPSIVYVANGGVGCCADRRDEYSAVAEQLLNAGYQMSKQTNIKEKYINLSDGSTVHMSDLMCQLIFDKIRKGCPTIEAMESAFVEMPSEVVGLMLRKEETDRISFARYNFPMFAGFSMDGAFMSSTPIAFPEEVNQIIPIPAMSCGYLTESELIVKPMKNPGIQVRVLNEAERYMIFDVIKKVLSERETNAIELSELVKGLFPPNDCLEPYQEINSILYALQKTGSLVINEKRVPGAREDVTAPKLYMKLI